MKTAKFEYTHGNEIDNSSLAAGVYYNSTNYTLAIEFHEYAYGTPSAFYAGVSEQTYRDLVNANSLGVAYNTQIKDKFANISGGTIYNVDYVPADGAEDNKVAEEKDFTYMVHGYVRQKLTIKAKDRDEARAGFLHYLENDGYEPEDIAVTEVVIIG